MHLVWSGEQGERRGGRRKHGGVRWAGWGMLSARPLWGSYGQLKRILFGFPGSTRLWVFFSHLLRRGNEHEKLIK